MSNIRLRFSSNESPFFFDILQAPINPNVPKFKIDEFHSSYKFCAIFSKIKIQRDEGSDEYEPCERALFEFTLTWLYFTSIEYSSCNASLRSYISFFGIEF